MAIIDLFIRMLWVNFQEPIGIKGRRNMNKNKTNFGENLAYRNYIYYDMPMPSD